MEIEAKTELIQYQRKDDVWNKFKCMEHIAVSSRRLYVCIPFDNPANIIEDKIHNACMTFFNSLPLF